MKINHKKTNPAFKLRQVLPQLPNLPGRVGGAVKEVAKVSPAQSPASGTPAGSWVTTE